MFEVSSFKGRQSARAWKSVTNPHFSFWVFHFALFICLFGFRASDFGISINSVQAAAFMAQEQHYGLRSGHWPGNACPA